MKNNCTMLVCTCDTYEDTWEPFFKSLKKYWKNFNMPIVLNTESKDYKMEGLDIQTFHLFENKKVRWGERLIEHLKRIDTKYIFFMLDDFFLVKPVNTDVIEQCYEWMEKDDNIAVFSFHRVDDPTNIPSEKYSNFDRRAQKGMYRMNCQAALWRKDRLIKFIKKYESPWDWEIYGTIRSARFKDEFYAIREGLEEPLDYNMYSQGTGICRGKWVKEVVEPLFKELDVHVDFSIRGFCDGSDVTVNVKRTFLQKVKERLKRYRAIIQSWL